MKKKQRKISSLSFQPYSAVRMKSALFWDFTQRRLVVSSDVLGTSPIFRVNQLCLTSINTKFLVLEVLLVFSGLGKVIYKFPKSSFLVSGALYFIRCDLVCFVDSSWSA